MRNAVIASTALMASSALAQGTARVINSCSYDVYMSNTPAQGGGFEAIDKVLSAGGGSYSQQWTQLGNDMGWSIKLAKTASYQTNLMQYEYTYLNDGIIWYDLSEVDGNPWTGNWMITASGANCSPKQQAYRYSTDDAYGMQSCPDAADITVTLCSSESDAGGNTSSVSESSAASTPAPSSYEQGSSTQQPTPTSTENSWTWGGVKKAAEITPSPTTLVTKAVSVSNAGGYDVTVTDVQTEVVTAYVTARHAHHPRHPHQPREE